MRKPETEQTSRFMLARKLFLHVFWHNIGYKLLALVLALLLWGLFITQDETLTRVKRFQDVSVSYEAALAELQQRGFTITSDLKQLLSNVTVEADVPQLEYDNATPNAYNISLDLSTIKESGKNIEVKLISESDSRYGTVRSITPSAIPIEVEPYTTRYRVPVYQETVGSVPDGGYAESPTLSPNSLVISGPNNLVASIKCAYVTVDLSKMLIQETEMRISVPFRLVDMNNQQISRDGLTIKTSDGTPLSMLNLEYKVYPTKQLTLVSDELVYTGTPAAGYEVMGVTCNRETITVAGPQSELNQLGDTILLSDLLSEQIDISNATSTIKRVRTLKSSALKNISPSNATLEILIGKKTSFRSVRVQSTGLDPELRTSASLPYVSVSIVGPQAWISSLKASNVKITCDLTGLGAGTHEVPLVCTFNTPDHPECKVQLSTETITVTLEPR